MDCSKWIQMLMSWIQNPIYHISLIKVDGVEYMCLTWNHVYPLADEMMILRVPFHVTLAFHVLWMD